MATNDEPCGHDECSDRVLSLIPVGRLVRDNYHEEPSFCHSDCDGCGDKLAGDRFNYTLSVRL